MHIVSFEINKIYTDCPYVDEMVYYSKLLGIGTVLKMQSVADRYETVDSLKAAGIYISCIEGTAVFGMFNKVTTSILSSAGIVDPPTVKMCLESIENVPLSKRDAITKALVTDYIENYEELNQYYRMLHGLPPIVHEDYITDWIPPEGILIDLSKPVHLMSNTEVALLEKYGVLEDMISEDPDNRLYMRHMGKKAIDYYQARRANRFDPLYIPTIDT